MLKQIDGKSQYWNRSAFISFVLAIMVIIRHNSSFANYDAMGELSDAFSYLYLIFKNSVTEIAVPAFFIIAGFNFYNGFSLENYGEKLKRRVKSLLVPYFAWNTLYCAFTLIASNTFISRFFIGREKYAFSLWNVIKGCLYHWSCNSHFWFVFNLILFALISPIAYRVLKKKWLGASFLVACILGIICLEFSIPEAFIYRTDSIVYYSIGGYLGLHFNDYIIGAKKIRARLFFDNHRMLIVFLGFCLVLCTAFLLIDGLLGIFRFIIILFGTIGLWIISGIVKNGTPSWVPSGGTVFLMYAMHGLIQPVIVKLLYLILPKQGWISIINFVASVLLTVLLCVIWRMFTKKHLKHVDEALTGWRR